MMPADVADASRAIDRRMALAKEWDDLVAQVRELDGFEDFLRPPSLEKLLPAAEAGPVIIVNVSRWRCDALIVTPSGIEVKPLAGLTAEAVSTRARAYLDGLQRAEEAASSAYPPGASPLADYEETLRDVTEWLWDLIAEPVLATLGYTGPQEPGRPWPRLWWCPTGLLSLLPLHAAGRHTPEGRARHESVLDRVVSSYTPTLRALLEARAEESSSAARARDRMLIVALAQTPGQVSLPNVARERQLLSQLFRDNHTILADHDASWESVREQLPRHGWVHFSCHGDQNLADPSRGGIMLHDRPLTIAEISDGQYHGDFAFLSACKTATGGVTLPDEAITLAAALHYTGYRHVIGTLWSIRDRTAAAVAEAVYTDLTSSGTFEPGRAATALHIAVRRLRDAGRPLSQWALFTHTGP